MKVLDKIKKELKENMEHTFRKNESYIKKIDRLNRIEEEVKTNVFLQNIVNELGKTEEELERMEKKRYGGDYYDFACLDTYRRKLLKLLFGEEDEKK